MYWYNPTTRTSERVQAPSTDEQAIQMLGGTQDSEALIKEYCELRRLETPIEQALVLVGHEFRLSQPECRLARREESGWDGLESPPWRRGRFRGCGWSEGEGVPMN